MSKIPVVYLAFADDAGAPLPQLQREHRRIRKALLHRDDQDHFRLRGWWNTGIDETFQELSRYRQQLVLFHFAGHAAGSFLQFVDHKGFGAGLSGFMSRLDKLRLIFLNGCATRQLAEQLIERGARAVIGTALPVADEKAAAFAVWFYEFFSQQQSIEEAYKNAVDRFKAEYNDYEQAGYHIRGIRIRDGDAKDIPWMLVHRPDDPDSLLWRLPATSTSIDDYPRRLTSFLPRFDVEKDLIGREQDLGQLRRRLQSSQKLVLMNGMGGIGKTTLAMAYLNKYAAEYDHLVWIDQVGDLETAMIATEGLLQNLKIDASTTDEKALLSTLLNRFHNHVQGHNLLIIDNADEQAAELEPYLPGPPGWHVLITSRQKLPGFTPMELDTLLPEDARALFYEHYRRQENDVRVDQILQQVEYHTLTIELIATTAQQRRISLDDLYGQLSAAGLKLGKKARLQPRHNRRQAVPFVFPYLREVFDLAGLSEEEKSVLLFCALLPPTFHPYELLEELWQSSDREDEEFDLVLDTLEQKNWLIAEGDSYKIHQVVQEVVLAAQADDLPEYLFLVESITQKLSIDQTKDNPIDKFEWVPFGEQLLQFFVDDSGEVSILKNELALVFSYLGQYDKARELLEKALQSDLRNFGADHPDVAAAQSNLALVYDDLGQYEKARELLEKALQSDFQNFGADHPTVAVRQSNLAHVYRNLGQYGKARELLEKALQSDLQNFGADHPTVAVRQSNLANVYADLGQYDKARELLEKALHSAINNFENEHPTVSVNQSNLANVYRDLGQCDKARELLEKALHSDLQNFGQDHPTVAVTQSNLALVYRDLGQYDKARELLEKALQSDLQNFGADHPDVAVTQSNLAKVYRNLGDINRARELWTQAADISTRSLGADHPRTKTLNGYLDSLSDE